MREKLMLGLVFGALAVLLAFGAYTWGYYDGMNDHAVTSSMSEANWSLSVAKSIRKGDTRLALQLLESNISWVDTALRLDPGGVPGAEVGNYRLVLRRLDDYRARYSRARAD